MTFERAVLIASLRRCLVEAVGEPRLTSRASNAVMLIYALGIRDETRAWHDIHPSATARLHPPQVLNVRTLSRTLCAIEDSESPRLQAALVSEEAVEHYLAVEQLSMFEESEERLREIAASDPEPVIRIAAIGGLALDDVQWEPRLLAAAGDAAAHVCVPRRCGGWAGWIRSPTATSSSPPCIMTTRGSSGTPGSTAPPPLTRPRCGWRAVRTMWR